jgi:uncharacterized protein (TIGR02996 family)
MTEAGFIAAVLASPDNDTPRLAFADWLEENGRPERAEFIRVQCELARIGSELKSDETCGLQGCDCESFPKLRRREQELLGVGMDGFLTAELPDFGRSFSCTVQWVRGFVEGVETSGDSWVEHAGAILARHPVRRVTLGWLPQIHSCQRYVGQQVEVWLTGMEAYGKAFDLEDLNRIRIDPLNYVVETLLARRWPGIKFTLPATAAVGRLQLARG